MAQQLQVIEERVRTEVRRQAIDPMRDREALNLIIADVVAHYDEETVAAAAPILTDRAQVTRSIVDTLAGFGPLQPLLDDPAIEEIWINGPAQVFVAGPDGAELTSLVLGEQELHDLIERMLRSSGRRLDMSTPFVDACLPGGERLHVVIPDITRRHMAVNIRKHIVKVTQLDDLMKLGSLDDQAAELLTASVRAGLNIMVSGATQAGKTTMLNALAGAIPGRERVVTAEEVFELKVPGRDVVPMQCRQPNLEGKGEVTLRRLVKEALRMRPDRLIIGEVRQDEALDLLIALNSGIPGMGTVHASSAREAITKLCTLPLLAGPNVTHDFVVPTVASSIDLVVHLSLDERGHRRVQEIVSVPGRIEGQRIESATVCVREGNSLRRHMAELPRPERFKRIGIDPHQLGRGAGRLL